MGSWHLIHFFYGFGSAIDPNTVEPHVILGRTQIQQSVGRVTTKQSIGRPITKTSIGKPLGV